MSPMLLARSEVLLRRTFNSFSRIEHVVTLMTYDAHFCAIAQLRTIIRTLELNEEAGDAGERKLVRLTRGRSTIPIA